MRHKRIEYVENKFIIDMGSDSRNFHLTIGTRDAELKIKSERLSYLNKDGGAPFSVLFRAHSYRLFRDALEMM